MPGDLATLLALGIGAGPAWSPGQHVFLGSGLSVYWDGTTFQPGKAPAAAPSPSTTVTEGAPGAFDNDVPATIDALVALGIGSGPLWGVGSYVALGDGSLVYWNGSAFIPGKSPVGSPVPVLLVAPKINGIANGVAEVTGTFTHTPGVWYGAPAQPVFDGWYFNAPGSPPASVGTLASYTTLSSQLGGTLRVRETVTGLGAPAPTFPGQSAPASVNYQVIAITDPGTITGTGIAGQVLTHSDPTVNYPLGATIVRHWQVDGVDVLAGPLANSPTYTPTVGDIGKSIGVRVVASNARPSTDTAATNTILAIADPSLYAPTLNAGGIPDAVLDVAAGDQTLPMAPYFDRGKPIGTFSLAVTAAGAAPVLQQGWGPVSLAPGATYDASAHLLPGASAPVTYSLTSAAGVGAFDARRIRSGGVRDRSGRDHRPGDGHHNSRAFRVRPGHGHPDRDQLLRQRDRRLHVDDRRSGCPVDHRHGRSAGQFRQRRARHPHRAQRARYRHRPCLDNRAVRDLGQCLGSVLGRRDLPGRESACYGSGGLGTDWRRLG